MKFKLLNIFSIFYFILFMGGLILFIYWQYSTIKLFHNIELNNFFNQTNNMVNILIEKKKSEIKNMILTDVKLSSNKLEEINNLNNVDFLFITKNSEITDIKGYNIFVDIKKVAEKLKNTDNLDDIIKIEIDSKPYYIIAHKEKIVDNSLGKVKGELWGVMIINENQLFINSIKTDSKVGEIILIDKNKNIIASTVSKKDTNYYLPSELNTIDISKDSKYLLYKTYLSNNLNSVYIIDNHLYNNIYQKFFSKVFGIIIGIFIFGIIIFLIIRHKFIFKLIELKEFIKDTIQNKKTVFKPSKIEELDEIAYVFERLFLDFKSGKERFELAIESTKDGLWDWNPITDEVFFSKTWKNMLGYKDNEIKFEIKEWRKRVHPDDFEKAINDIKSHIEGKTPLFENIHRLKHKDGHWVWIYSRGKALFDDKGKAYRVVGFHTDLSLQKSIEEENSKKDKLLLEQAKYAQMGEMIENIAHQWRQPLSVITTTASGIKFQKEFNTLDDNFLIEALEGILKSANYLSDTINTFRAYIKEKREFKKVFIQDRLNSVLDIVKASLSNNHIELINNIDYSKPIEISLIIGELSEVIINIINNAKDVLVERRDENRWIKIELYKKDNIVVITIEDNGGGVPPNIINKIFNPYFTTKHQSQGTGLGLHMSKEIITKHLDGNIYVKNSTSGAKFFIELPLGK